ncbi:WD repeat-containing protein 6, partial [Rhizopus stolonifer]
EQPLVLFGHTARVWDCQFVNEHLISISEDATCRVWRNTLLLQPGDTDDNQENNDCIACWEGHVSKNVWSCAINPDNKVVATGGQDSGIRLWSLASVSNSRVDSDEDLCDFPLSVDKKKDYVRNFVMVKDQWLVGATTEGYLLRCDRNKQPHEWIEIQHDPSYRNYAIMKSSKCGRVVIVGNIHGDLIVLSPENMFESVKISAHKQKLFEIFIETSATDENILYVVSNGYNERVLFHRLDLSGSKPSIRTLFNIEMPTEKTTVLSVGIAEEENILICGSRESALLIYHMPYHKDVQEGTIQNLKASLQMRRSHGRQAITSVLVGQKTYDEDDEEEEVNGGITFWTTGRDGCYIQYRLSLINKTLELNNTDSEEVTQLGVASRGDTVVQTRDMILEKIYRNKVTKGTLEGSLLVDGELLLLGFFRKDFFVYNEKKNFVVVSINCGGGHRRWSFSTEDAKLNKSAFAFIRKEVLFAYFRNTSSINDGFNDSILQNNYHGREVRALCFLDSFSEDKHNPILFATGGEDTILRIQQYMPNDPSGFYTHVNIRKHTTVIKNINFSRGLSSLLFTSGGLEELRCWKIEATPSKTINDPANINCLEVSSCPSLTKDIEVRIMDTTAFAITPEYHIIGAVYSDAMIRFWLFNESSRKFSLIADGTWHSKCILQISHVQIDQQIYFFTSATEGGIAMWDISDQLYSALGKVGELEAEPTIAAFGLSKPLYYYRTHMSGVNALETVSYKDNKHILVVTGGEDNAVSASLLHIQGDNTVKSVGDPFVIPGAHASSVTGIKHINDVVFTCSTDQRLNVWKINDLKDNGVSLTLSTASYMDVPDPSSLDAIASDFPLLLTVEQPSHNFLTEDRTFIVRTVLYKIEALGCCHATNVGCCCLVKFWKADLANWDNNDIAL